MAILFFFLRFILPAVWKALPETDLWWMLPGVAQHLGGRSPLGILAYLFSPGPPLFDHPIFKIYLWFFYSFLHLPLRVMICSAILLHLCNAWMVNRVGRQMGLDPRASLCAAIVYFTFFASFHAYFWPPAVQHIVAVLTILLIWSFYLSVEEKAGGRPIGWKRLGLLAFLLGVFGSLQRSSVIAPAMILTHLLFCSRDARQRWERYQRWLPFFAVYGVYPMVALSTVGDLVSITAIAKYPLPGGVKAVGFLSLAWGGLLLLRWVLDRAARRPSAPSGRKWIKAAVWGIGAAVVFALAVRDSREVLFPYNAVAPWLTAVSSFLSPLQYSLLPDSTDGYYILPPQITPFALLFSVLSLLIFLRRFVSRHSPLVGLAVWYAVCLAFILLSRHIKTSFPPQIPSRYFVYLAPLVAWVGCASALWVYGRTVRQIRLKPAAAEVLLAGLLAFLCAANIVAVRLEIFRCKLVNTYLLYDDWKTVSLIRQDLEGKIGAESNSPLSLSVENVSPMLFSPRAGKFLPVAAIPLFNFRWLAGEVFENQRVGPWLINSPAGKEAMHRYRLEGGRVVDADGKPLDRFSQWADQAFVKLREGKRSEAMELFLRAVQERPFLLQYLLSSCRLSDLRWITQGRGLRDWLREIDTRYARWSIGPHEKRAKIRSMVERETGDYLLCLFAMAYLHHEQGHLLESRAWLSQIQYLEDDPADLAAWIGNSTWVRENPSVQDFLKKLQDPFYLEHPLPWRMDDYGFGRFLFRLLMGRDIRSGWEQTPGRVV